MSQWEYTKQQLLPDADLATLQAAGEDGWQCFQLVKLDNGQWLAYFVREVVPVAELRVPLGS